MKILDSLTTILSDFLSTSDSRNSDGLNWHSQRNLNIPDSCYLFSNFKLLEVICTLLPLETKEVELEVVTHNTDVDLGSELIRWLNRENIIDRIAEASIIGRIFGSGYLIADLDDGQDADQPINLSRLREIGGWHIRSIGDLRPIVDYSQQKITGYQVMFSPLSNPVIHKDRVFVLPGKRLYGEALALNSYEHQSYMQDVLQSLFEYIKAVSGVSNMVHDSRLLTYSMKGLGKLINTKDDVGIAKRLQALFAGLKQVSNYRMLLHDADTEQIGFTSYNFAGVDNAVDAAKGWLQANCDIPHTKLWNEGSQGSTSGRSELEDWNDARLSYANSNWLDIVRKIADWYLVTKKNKRQVNKGCEIDVSFLPFSSETKLEVVSRMEKKVNMLNALAASGLITREEVRLNLTSKSPGVIKLLDVERKVEDSVSSVNLSEEDLEEIFKNAEFSEELGGYIFADEVSST